MAFRFFLVVLAFFSDYSWFCLCCPRWDSVTHTAYRVFGCFATAHQLRTLTVRQPAMNFCYSSPFSWSWLNSHSTKRIPGTINNAINPTTTIRLIILTPPILSVANVNSASYSKTEFTFSIVISSLIFLCHSPPPDPLPFPSLVSSLTLPLSFTVVHSPLVSLP